jgi:hypothetical protein
MKRTPVYWEQVGIILLSLCLLSVAVFVGSQAPIYKAGFCTVDAFPGDIRACSEYEHETNILYTLLVLSLIGLTGWLNYSFFSKEGRQ